MPHLEVGTLVVAFAFLPGPLSLAVAVVVPVSLLPLLAAPRRVHEVRVEPEQVKIQRVVRGGVNNICICKY